MQADTVWRWGGGEFPFDATDAECIGRVSEAVRRVNEKLSARKDAPWDDGRDLDGLSRDAAEYCQLVELFFDALFGENASERLFPGPSMARHAEAYAAFIAFAVRQLNALEDARRRTLERYGRMADALPADDSGEA